MIPTPKTNAEKAHCKLPLKMDGAYIKCANFYNVGHVNGHMTTEGMATSKLLIDGANEHDLLTKIAEAAEKCSHGASDEERELRQALAALKKENGI